VHIFQVFIELNIDGDPDKLVTHGDGFGLDPIVILGPDDPLDTNILQDACSVVPTRTVFRST